MLQQMRRMSRLLAVMMMVLALAFGTYATGAIVSPTVAAAKTAGISKSKAVTIALKDAKLKKSQVKKLKAEKDTEDGRKVWEVEFRTSTHKYEYDIARSSGKIVGKDVRKIKASKKSISETKAVTIALKDAKLKKSQVKGLKVEKGTEDGRKVWEVEFRYGGYEYEYDIACSSGKIVGKDVERA